ncbi:uncharacterized protein PV09_04782 [Verruconis gallopava]|uniref:Uncharacterized protein n=1 Tax=Verruconis gallopava TaxID=253628 RepID=A0A0D2AXQ8_9PEZI|nr:uncharacterized protein PV09_04782 [Verruconis gallopava]KIW03944.1 hypothetical protein PV09_04782 [Verruconis gallopava]
MPPRPAERDSRLSIGARNVPSFSLDTFASKDFIVKDFIENLSESAIHPSGRRSAPASTAASTKEAFDPKPLIRAFEATLARLGSLSEELNEQETELSASVRRAEAQHNSNVASLSKKLEQAIEQFNRLDNTLNGSDASGRDGPDSGGAFALRTGERLEELERQHKRAQDAKFLIQCWNEVSEKNTLGPLEDMRRSGGSDKKVRCASIAQQLLKISHRLDPEPTVRQTNGTSKSLGVNGTSNGNSKSQNGSANNRLSSNGNATRETIERFLESLEKDLLDQFDDHYRRQNFEGMKECATALRDFNDGASVMALFVNQHNFFIDRSQLVTDEIAGDEETWARIGDPDAEPPGVEPGLQALIDEVRLVLQDESFYIRRAFPYYEEVLTRFLQRVFQQPIQQRLEMVLQKAESISSLAFLRTLQASRSYIGALVDDLKAHGLTEHPEPASAHISSVLDQQLDDLFVPYLLGSSYIEREKKSLEELYSSLLLKFTIYHSRRQKKPTTYLDRLGQRGRQLMDSARDAYMERLDSSELSASQKAMLLRIAGVKDETPAGGKAKAEIEVTEEDGKLSVATAKRMLRWLAEGVGRGLELSSPTETPKDVQQLLGLLFTQMGEIYLNSALEATLEMTNAQKNNTKTDPDLDFLPDLRTSISILHLLQTSVSTMLLPLATPNVTVRRDIEKTATSTLNTLENKISTILHETLDTVVAWVYKLLANQRKTDFRPRDEDLASAIESTPTCKSITTFLTKVQRLASLALDGGNLSNFLGEVASALRAALLEHLRKFVVSLTGGLVVSSDVTKYNELVRGWPLKDTAFEKEGGMDILVEVANLFVISPDALRERLRSSAEAGKVEVAELKKFVERREDAGSVGVQAVLSAL